MLPTAIALTGEPASPAITESSFDFEGNNTASKVLLIDLENCPNQIQHIHENLAAFTRVVICYAQSTAKIPLDWLLPLNQTINQGRLKVIQMTTKGKNSADFGIAFFAGSLMNEMPPHTEFVILSDDTDLDHVVNLLISQDIPAERIGVKKISAAAPTANKKNSAIETSLTMQRLKTFCGQLMQYPKARPAKQESLLNAIRSQCQLKNNEEKIVLNALLQNKIVTLNGSQVVYNNTLLQQFIANE
ncbi:NYN domain-containing protein [Thiopseudomonas alkaliphila]|uniref:NYN domain-containing protein n=1 Tax=Thiopseudomonas alkaliphila TaxID=1697053 RepID=A0AAW7DQ07_9GAMM|nr:PIN domain-containing protein [Thiopseudomonas alkaliphila]MDM1695380.1 NYN domain-containing protein [Thiopseudomonas alkaliphila]